MLIHSERQKNWLAYAVFACACIIVTSVYWHAQNLGTGEIWRYDAFHSYDRTLGFAANQDWLTVYSLGYPSLHKPPMQYWMSAVFIESGVDHVLALRIPSMIFAACAMITTAALAYAMFPQQVWLMPAAVLLLATSNLFWSHSTSAMLDSGAAFFSTLGVLSIFMSVRNPRYWPTFPIAVFLAGMQKGPTPLAFLLLALVGLMLTSRWHGCRVRTILKDRRFKFSVGAALLLGFAWPIFQELRHLGNKDLRGSIESEMLDRFIPQNLEILTEALTRFEALILVGEPTVRLAGFAGLLLLPLVSKRPEYFAMSSIAFLFVATILGSDRVYARYSLTILPLLSIGAAWLVFYLCRVPVIGLVAAVCVALFVGGPFRPPSVLAPGKVRYSVPLSEILGPMNDSIGPDETAVFCRMEKSMFPPGAVHIFVPNAGNGRHPYIRSIERIERDMRRYKGGPVRGVCGASEVEIIRPYFENVRTEPVIADFVMWTASSFRKPQTD